MNYIIKLTLPCYYYQHKHERDSRDCCHGLFELCRENDPKTFQKQFHLSRKFVTSFTVTNYAESVNGTRNRITCKL